MTLPIRLGLYEFSKILYTQAEQNQLFIRKNGFEAKPPSAKKTDHMVERGNCYLFRPVADVMDSELGGYGYSNFLGSYREALTNLDRPVIIPIMERGLLFGRCREHFTVLHYDPTTKKATLIESIASVVSRLYSLDALYRAMILAGIKPEGDIDVVYQNIQYDDGICGHIAAQNCRALFKETNPQNLENYLTKYDLPKIKEFNDSCENNDNKLEHTYTPVNVNFIQRHWGKFTALNVIVGMVAVMLISVIVMYATGGLASIPLIGAAIAAKLGVDLAGLFAAGAIFAGAAGIITATIMGVFAYFSRQDQELKPEQPAENPINEDFDSVSFEQISRRLGSASERALRDADSNERLDGSMHSQYEGRLPPPCADVSSGTFGSDDSEALPSIRNRSPVNSSIPVPRLPLDRLRRPEPENLQQQPNEPDSSSCYH